MSNFPNLWDVWVTGNTFDTQAAEGEVEKQFIDKNTSNKADIYHDEYGHMQYTLKKKRIAPLNINKHTTEVIINNTVWREAHLSVDQQVRELHLLRVRSKRRPFLQRETFYLCVLVDCGWPKNLISRQGREGEAYKNCFYLTYQILGIHLRGKGTTPELHTHTHTHTQTHKQLVKSPGRKVVIQYVWKE